MPVMMRRRIGRETASSTRDPPASFWRRKARIAGKTGLLKCLAEDAKEWLAAQTSGCGATLLSCCVKVDLPLLQLASVLSEMLSISANRNDRPRVRGRWGGAYYNRKYSKIILLCRRSALFVVRGRKGSGLWFEGQEGEEKAEGGGDVDDDGDDEEEFEHEDGDGYFAEEQGEDNRADSECCGESG